MIMTVATNRKSNFKQNPECIHCSNYTKHESIEDFKTKFKLICLEKVDCHYSVEIGYSS